MPLVLQCLKRSDKLGYNIFLEDIVEVPGKHYAVAVDLFDHKTDSVLDALLATMNRHDQITLVTFGDHIESVTFMMSDDVNQIVAKALSRKEQGCNVAIALQELQRVECDTRILISSGAFDDGEPTVNLESQVIRISPGKPCKYPKICMPVLDEPLPPGADLVLEYENKKSFRKEIRNILEKPRPNYYNIKIEHGNEIHWLKPLAYGGAAALSVSNFEGTIILSYFDGAGAFYSEEIKKE